MGTLRQSLIALRAAPIVTIVTIVSLMLDIGANTAIFSIVDGLLLRQLPVRDPQQLVLITGGNTVSPEVWNYAAWAEIHNRPELFENVAAWAFSQYNLASRGETRYVDGIAVSGSFFDTLGIPVLAGRGLSAGDDQPGGSAAGPVAVISYRFWQSEFAGQPDAIGRTLVLGGTPFTIVGIMPAYFYGPEPGRRFDAMVPLAAEPLATGVNRLANREWQWLTIIARLKHDQTEEAAAAALRGVQQQVRDASIPNLAPPFREQYLRAGFGLIPAATGTSTLRQRFQRPLVAVLVLVLLVQLIGSVNVANVLLARSSARQQEFGIRVALGASPRQMFTQLLVESLVLSICGAVSGMLLARWMSELLISQLWTQSGPVFLQLGIDWRVLTFTATVAVATALLCGVAPALRASRVDPIDTLNTRGQTGSLQRSRATAIAVIAQVALSTVILIAAALFLRTFQTLTARQLRFAPERLLLVRIDGPRVEVGQRVALYERVRSSVLGVPGVADAALSFVVPGGPTVFRTPVRVSGGADLPPQDRVTFGNVVSAGWSETFSTPAISGRAINENDRPGAPKVVVVNQAFVRRFLNGANPLGHTVTFDAPTERPGQSVAVDIVGVVPDVVYRQLRDPIGPTMYLPLAQRDELFFARGLGAINLVVKTRGDSPMAVARSVSAAVAAVNADFSFTVQPLKQQIDGSIAPQRIAALLSGWFGGLALLLALIGLYGVTSYTINQSRKEIALRLALGAAAPAVLRAVLFRVLTLIGIGLAIGLGVSVWASKFVSALLVGVGPHDFVAFATTAVVLVLSGAIAGWAPAYRASRVDPALLLREP